MVPAPRPFDPSSAPSRGPIRSQAWDFTGDCLTFQFLQQRSQVPGNTVGEPTPKQTNKQTNKHARLHPVLAALHGAAGAGERPARAALHRVLLGVRRLHGHRRAAALRRVEAAAEAQARPR